MVWTASDWIGRVKLGHPVPLLVNLQPAGYYLGEEYHRAGGVPAVVNELMKKPVSMIFCRDGPELSLIQRLRSPSGVCWTIFSAFLADMNMNRRTMIAKAWAALTSRDTESQDLVSAMVFLAAMGEVIR